MTRLLLSSSASAKTPSIRNPNVHYLWAGWETLIGGFSPGFWLVQRFRYSLNDELSQDNCDTISLSEEQTPKEHRNRMLFWRDFGSYRSKGDSHFVHYPSRECLSYKSDCHFWTENTIEYSDDVFLEHLPRMRIIFVLHRKRAKITDQLSENEHKPLSSWELIAITAFLG